MVVAMVPDHSWWEILIIIFGMLSGLWGYYFIGRKFFGSTNRMNLDESWALVYGFLMAVVLFKWNW